MNSPILNLIVLRSSDLNRAVRFYEALGFALVLEKHGAGPEHYSCEVGSVVLEIYPAGKVGASPGTCMYGFAVSSVQVALKAAEEFGGSIVSGPVETERGLRAVVLDPDGHRLELIGPNHSLKADVPIGPRP